jgi:hypothetical protein
LIIIASQLFCLHPSDQYNQIFILLVIFHHQHFLQEFLDGLVQRQLPADLGPLVDRLALYMQHEQVGLLR